MRLGQDPCLICHRLHPEKFHYFHLSCPWIYIGEKWMRIQLLIRKQCMCEMYGGFFFLRQETAVTSRGLLEVLLPSMLNRLIFPEI